MLQRLILISTVFFVSCGAKIGSTITNPQPPLNDSTFVLVLQKDEEFKNDGVKIGEIKAGDNGFSSNCSFETVIDELRRRAKSNGANLIKIISLKNPDHWSTCVRLTAELYKVPTVKSHEKEIEWSENRKLTWEDFKGTPRGYSNPDVAAQTASSFGFETGYRYLFAKTSIYTKTSFDCYLSWVLPNQKTPEILNHEQRHFDLTEIYARRLRKALKESNSVNNFSADEYNTIFKKIQLQYLDRQELYDKETNHGLKKDFQAIWNTDIDHELKELSAFSNNTLTK